MGYDITAYVEKHIREYEAEMRAKTMFGPAGRAVIRSQGERIVLGPRGEKLRVVQLPGNHTQVEHEDEHRDTHIHANVRPSAVNMKITTR